MLTSLVLEQFVYTERNSPESLPFLEIAEEAPVTDKSVAPQIKLVDSPHTQPLPPTSGFYLDYVGAAIDFDPEWAGAIGICVCFLRVYLP